MFMVDKLFKIVKNHIKLGKLTLAVLALLLIGGQAWAATYTIGPGQTYETFTALVATETLTGDDIVDGGGNVFSETWIPDGSGTSGHPIFLRNAIITGGIDVAQNFLNISRIKTKGPIILSGNNNTVESSISEYSYGNGFTISGTGNVILNIDILYPAGAGIEAQESCAVSNTIVRNTGGANVLIASTKAMIGKNNIFQDPVSQGEGTYTDSGGNIWSAELPDVKAVSLWDWTPSGVWPLDGSAYRQTVIGKNYNTSFENVFLETFTQANGAPANWTAQRGTFSVVDGKLNTTSTVYSLATPTTDYTAWDNYRFTVKVTRLGAPDAAGYAMIYFRSTVVAGADTGYLLFFRQTGTMDLWKRLNGANDGNLSSATSIPKDNDEHTLHFLLNGSSIKIWLDTVDETTTPKISVTNSVHSSGTIGVGCHTWNAKFDDISISSADHTIAFSTSHIYSSGNSTVTFTNSLSTRELDNLSVSIRSPDGTNHNYTGLSGCAGNNSCSVSFPSGFAGIGDSVGQYKITATNDNDVFHNWIDVRQTPLVSFLVASDFHYNSDIAQINSLVSDVNNQTYFPKPNFVVATGDLAEDGTSAQLGAVKTALDSLVGVEYYPIIGNHDSDADGAEEKGATWDSVFGGDKSRFSYTWSVGDYLFLALDYAAGFGGYGATINSVEHQAFVSSAISANAGKKKILFTHPVIQQLRTGGGAVDHWVSSEDIRSLMNTDSDFIGNFSGHNHLTGLKQTDNIIYASVGSYKYNDEYRWCLGYADRLECQNIPRNGYRSDQAGKYWVGSTDALHDADHYSFGLPAERQFVFDYASRTINYSDLNLQDGSLASGGGCLGDGVHNLPTAAKYYDGTDVTCGPNTGAMPTVGAAPIWANLNGMKLIRGACAATISGDHSAETMDLSNAINAGQLTVLSPDGFQLGGIIGNPNVTIVGSGAPLITPPITLGNDVKMHGFQVVH